MQKNILSHFLRKLFDADFLVLSGLLLIPICTTTQLHDYYTVPKWSLVYILSILTGIYLIFQYKNIQVPSLNKFTKIIFGLTLLFLGINYFYHNMPFNHHYTLDRLCFIILAVYGIQSFLRKPTLPTSLFTANLIATGLVILQGALQFYDCRISSYVEVKNENCFSSTFGNINMTAQFLGISLIFQLFSFKKPTHKYIDWIKPLIFILSLTYIYFAMCRSIYIAAALLLVTVFIIQKPIQRKNLVTLLLCSLLSILVISPLSKLKKPEFNMKKSSTSDRLETYKETLRMVLENPLGIGIGQYEFGHIPYQMGGQAWPSESEVLKSPHNSFLRYLAEDGFVLSALFLTFLMTILLHRRKSELDDTSLLLYLFLIVLFIEALFQFPLENAYPFYIFAILLGRYTAKNHPLRSMASLKALTTIASLTVVACGLTLTFIASKYFEANHYTDYDKSSMACSLHPYNWRVCLNKAKIEAGSNPQKAFQTLKLELEKRPFNHVAMGVWGVMELRLKREADGCTTLLVRDAFFNNISSYIYVIASRCTNYMGVISGSPLRDHKSWLLKNDISLKSPIIR